ncbi:MAG: hypothetical protein HQL46_12380 [Gammaproteobacteria bacterium]|nr:hypothetical protein [Gammaproteobacteria bacterium]
MPFKTLPILITTLLIFSLFSCTGTDSGDSAESNNDFNEPLPIANIIVDGEFSDWGNVQIKATDPIGDQNGSTSADLVSYSVARDESQIFILIEVDGEIAFPLSSNIGSSGYGVYIHFWSNEYCNLPEERFGDTNFLAAVVRIIDGQIYSSIENHIEGGNNELYYAYNGSKIELSFNIYDIPENAKAMDFRPSSLSYGPNVEHDKFSDDVINTGCYIIPE